MVKQFIESISQFPKISISNIIEIIIIIFIVYKLITMLKNTRAWIILKGLGILYAIYAITDLLSLHVLSETLKFTTMLTLIVVIMALQPDIRKIIERLGNKKISDISLLKSITYNKTNVRYSDNTISALVDSLLFMSRNKTGALIVVEKDTPLDDIIASGININADITSQLLNNIFEDKTPLHDGAVIIRGDKILSATAYLPLSNNPSIDKELGTRHRAAIGVTEASDSFVLVSSEETGQISFVKNGIIKRNLNKETLTNLLKEEQGLVVETSKNKPFFANPQLKLASAFIGFAIWFVVMTGINPVVTKEFKDIKVISSNTDVVKDKTITLDTDRINVVLEDRKSVIDKISMSDITAVADMKKLSITNAVRPDIKVNGPSSIRVKSTSQDVITAKIDNIGYVEAPVDVVFSGTLKKGSSLKSVKLLPENLNLSGGKTQLEKLGKVVCNVDLSDISNNKEYEYTPQFFDKNGDEIQQDKIKIIDITPKYKAEIEPVKEIELKINVYDGEKSAGRITHVSYKPKKVNIMGNADALKGINSLKIDIPININIADINNKKISKIININDYLSKEFRTTEGNDKVTIDINYEPFPEKKMNINSDNINFIGKNQLFEYDIDSNFNNIPVTVFAQKSNLELLKEADISISADVSSLTSVGKYSIPITISSKTGVGISTVKEIGINIRKKVEPVD